VHKSKLLNIMIR